MLNPPVNGKIQGLFKAFEFFKYFSRQIYFSRTFQDNPVYSSTFQACVNHDTRAYGTKWTLHPRHIPRHLQSSGHSWLTLIAFRLWADAGRFKCLLGTSSVSTIQYWLNLARFHVQNVYFFKIKAKHAFKVP